MCEDGDCFMTDPLYGEHNPKRRLLFQHFPGLIGKLPWMPLADLPTPVRKLTVLGEKLGMTDLWIKRDDQNSDLYSGNKPRKFEFILAEAKAMGRREVITMGSAGSNHGTATSLFCCRYGFDSILYLNPQPVLSYVRQNILVNACNRARTIYSPHEVVSVMKMLVHYAQCKLNRYTPPYFMYFGGSSRPGNAGFVEAGLELAKQIHEGQLPLPRHLFVATGSCGTHAGLLIGLRLAGIPTEVIGVRIVPKIVTNRFVVAFHANRTIRFLRSLDPTFPAMHVSAAEIRLLDDYFGGQYGRPTAEGKAAIRTAWETEELCLDPTYTGKTFAGMLDFIRDKNLRDEPVLFWQTLNGADLSSYVAGASRDELPAELQRYFDAPLCDPDL